jgi:hypothetical protein
MDSSSKSWILYPNAESCYKLIWMPTYTSMSVDVHHNSVEFVRSYFNTIRLACVSWQCYILYWCCCCNTTITACMCIWYPPNSSILVSRDGRIPHMLISLLTRGMLGASDIQHSSPVDSKPNIGNPPSFLQRQCVIGQSPAKYSLKLPGFAERQIRRRDCCNICSSGSRLCIGFPTSDTKNMLLMASVWLWIVCDSECANNYPHC